MTESNIQGLWEWMKACPLLSEYVVGVNFGTDDFDSAGVVETSTDTIRTYIDGAKLRALHASLYLGALSYSDMKRIETSAFFERLRAWFIRASEAGDLPELPEGRCAEEISMGDAIPFEYENEGQKCTYQMHIILEFTERI